MQAVVYYASKDIRVETVPIPGCGDDEIRVKVDACAVCGSEGTSDVVIVAAPAAKPQEDALDLVRKRGTVCLFASLPAGQSMLLLDSRKIHYGEVRVIGTSDCTAQQVVKAVELLANNRLPAEKLATHILPFEKILTAFELMQRGEALRVVLKP
jgi:L-iditol 2-dehydrogenase